MPNNPNLSEIQPMTARQMAAEVLKFLLEPFRYYYYSSFAPQRVFKEKLFKLFLNQALPSKSSPEQISEVYSCLSL